MSCNSCKDSERSISQLRCGHLLCETCSQNFSSKVNENCPLCPKINHSDDSEDQDKKKNIKVPSTSKVLTEENVRAANESNYEGRIGKFSFNSPTKSSTKLIIAFTIIFIPFVKPI